MQMAEVVASMILRASWADKKKLLEILPSKLDGVITPATSGTIITLWKVKVNTTEK
jgi:hypothetical protein